MGKPYKPTKNTIVDVDPKHEKLKLLFPKF
jgi:hypothetical protein